MSIYDYLKDKTPKEIANEGYRLPDLDMQMGEVWVPGAYEGTLLRSNVSTKLHTIINFLTACAVKKQTLKPSEKNKAKLMTRLKKYPAISLVDPVCSYCFAFKIPQNEQKKEALRVLALDLAKNSNDREPVKMGLALLGISGKEEDLQILEILGKHDEFTLYAAGAAIGILKDKKKNEFLIKLAENVEGWGKLSILYELDYSDKAARLWTVKKGCRNSVGLSYAANVCAIKGGMAEILKKLNEREYSPAEAEDIYHGVCDIFTGLLWPDEGQDGIREYTEAVFALREFKKITENMPDLSSKDERTSKILDFGGQFL